MIFQLLISDEQWFRPPINHSIFWKSVMITFRWIYVNGFLLALEQNCKKCTFLYNLMTITQEGNMKTRRMTSFFLSIFSTLTVCYIHFCIWKWSKFILCGPPFGPFWSVKCLNFGVKLPIQTSNHTFLESRHPEVTKNTYFILSPEGSQGINSWTICVVWCWEFSTEFLNSFF